MSFAITGARVFDGETFRDSTTVVVDGAHIRAVADDAMITRDMETIRLDGGLLAPGFVDVQVNGGGGFLLNDAPTVETVMGIAAAHRRFGTTAMLPTVITDAPQVMMAAMAAARDARAQGAASILGLHVEGPFLDPVRKGAHDAKYIRAMTEVDVEVLTRAGCGALMLTVAPNKVSPAMIRRLTNAGVRVSLGHSDASYLQARAALDAGASAFTHLFNAMSQMTGREPGMVGAALRHPESYIGVIADGLHVHDVSLQLAFHARSTSHFMLISDAMPPAAGGPDVFHLQRRRVMRVDGRLQLEDGTLAGSNLTMDAAVRYCVGVLDVPLAEALQMASRNPARFVGRADLGVIKPQALASLVHLDDDLAVMRTWVEGR